MFYFICNELLGKKYAGSVSVKKRFGTLYNIESIYDIKYLNPLIFARITIMN